MSERTHHSELLDNTAAEKAMPPAVLLGYQQRWVADKSPLKIAEKSRRIGLTWAEASDDTLEAASADGSNTFYIGPTQDMAVEFIEACGMWARAYDSAATEIEEGIFVDTGAGENGADRHIKTFKIDFPGSKRRIVALSSRPKNLRGKQGNVVIDEAAFHDNLDELIKAAMAMLLWGHKVRIISTHDGVENPFNELIQNIRAGKRKGSVHRITFQDAVADGLYRRVCIRLGIEWTKEGEEKWISDAYDFYGDDAAEELDAVPSQGGGAFFSMALVESIMTTETPLIRKRFNAEFNLTPEPERFAEVQEWISETIDPVLITLNPALYHAFGQDFGRKSDLTDIIVGEEGKDLVTRVKFVVELSNCPFAQQDQILAHIIERLPRFRAGAMDASGNGAATAEKMADRFGGTKIEQVKLSESFYLENFPPLKGAIEDKTFDCLPRDSEIRDDLRAVRVINGVPKLPNTKTQRGDGKKLTRHGDAAVACMMLHYAIKRDVYDINDLQVSQSVRPSADTRGWFSE